MNVRERRQLDGGLRIRAFGADRPDIFGATPTGPKLLTDLDTHIGDVQTHLAALESGMAKWREGTTLRAAARGPLRGDVESTSRTARFLAVETSGLDDKFPMPGGVSDQHLASIARAFAQDAAPLADAFVAHGLPADVLPQLPARIEALEHAIRHQEAGKEACVAARAAMRASFASLRTTIDGLHRIVMTGPGRDPATVAVWMSARRIGPARAKAPDATPPPAPAPAPTTESAV